MRDLHTRLRQRQAAGLGARSHRSVTPGIRAVHERDRRRHPAVGQRDLARGRTVRVEYTLELVRREHARRVPQRPDRPELRTRRQQHPADDALRDLRSPAKVDRTERTCGHAEVALAAGEVQAGRLIDHRSVRQRAGIWYVDGLVRREKTVNGVRHLNGTGLGTRVAPVAAVNRNVPRVDANPRSEVAQIAEQLLQFALQEHLDIRVMHDPVHDRLEETWRAVHVRIQLAQQHDTAPDTRLSLHERDRATRVRKRQRGAHAGDSGPDDEHVRVTRDLRGRERFVLGCPRDRRGNQVGCFLGRLSTVRSHPSALLADVRARHEIPIDASGLAGRAKRFCVLARRTGGEHRPCTRMLGEPLCDPRASGHRAQRPIPLDGDDALHGRGAFTEDVEVDKVTDDRPALAQEDDRLVPIGSHLTSPASERCATRPSLSRRMESTSTPSGPYALTSSGPEPASACVAHPKHGSYARNAISMQFMKGSLSLPPGWISAEAAFATEDWIAG